MAAKCSISPIFALSGSQHFLAKNGSDWNACQTNQRCLPAWFSILMKFSVLKPLSETQEKAKVAGSIFGEDGKEALCTLAQQKAASP